MSQNNTLTHGKLYVSNSTKEHEDNSGNHADLWPLKIWLTTRSKGYSFLLITQYKMPFINKSEATKRPKGRKINRKCTNGTNLRSRVWPVCFIYIRDERNDLERTSSADAKTSWYFAFSMSSNRLSASDTAVSPIEDASAIWSCTMLFNGRTTITTEVSPVRVSLTRTSTWNIRLFPKPFGSTASRFPRDTSVWIALVCSVRNSRDIPKWDKQWRAFSKAESKFFSDSGRHFPFQ